MSATNEDCSPAPCSAEFVQIGWVSHGMNETRIDNYKAMFGKGEVRVPPKIYKTKQVAARYGTPTPVFIKQNGGDHTRNERSE